MILPSRIVTRKRETNKWMTILQGNKYYEWRKYKILGDNTGNGGLGKASQSKSLLNRDLRDQ